MTQENEMERIYVLDTNVLLNDSNAIYTFEDSTVIIPLVVLEEIDKIKSRADDAGRAARQVARTLNELRKTGNLNVGIRLERSRSTLKVCSADQSSIDRLPVDLQNDKFDNIIIATALSEKAKSKAKGRTVTLVTNDVNVALKCDALGLLSEDYTKLRALDDASAFYKGYEVLDVEPDVVDALAEAGWAVYEHDFCPNHYVNVRTLGDRSVLAKARDKHSLVRIKDIDTAFGLKPRNLEQRFSLDLLFDNSVKLVTLCGASGTGKTLLALAAGMQQVVEAGTNSRYDRLIVTRPVQPVGKDIGFLPGTLLEKMEPWIAPIKDNLDHLCRTKRTRKDEPYLDLLLRNKKIEIEAITYIRGRSIPNSFIIIDEAQNLSLHELKTIITRVGDGTKIVLTGDIEQIDNNNVDLYTNGLTYAVESFKDYKISGHITLTKGERSELATLASKIL